MTKLLRIASCLFLLASLPAHADEGLSRLMQSLASVKSSTARFSETRTLAMLDAPIVSTGTLAWRAPGHIERVTLTPQPESLIVDGDSLTLTADGKTRVVGLADIPGVGALTEAIRSTLAGNLAALQAHYTVTMQGDAAHWVLLLQPTEGEVQHMIQYVRISGEGTALRDIETLEADGDKSDMAITPAGP